jgi:hypothetical protein
VKEETIMAKQQTHNDWPGLMAQIPEAWLANLRSMSEASGALANCWFKNRSAQIQSNLEAWAKLTACKDGSEAAEVAQRWLQSTVDRMTAEAGEYRERAMHGLSWLGDDKPPPAAKAG